MDKLERLNADDLNPTTLLRQAEGLPPASASLSDTRERVELYTKLFSVYPLARSQNLEAAMTLHIEETSDIPVRWLKQAVSELVKDPSLTFVPPIGVIRDKALRAIRRARRASKGKAPDPWNAHGDTPPRAEIELEWAQRMETPQLEEAT